MTFWAGATASWKTAATRSASGTRAGSPIPPRRRVASIRISAPGEREEPEPRDRLGDVVARVVAELVREDDVHLRRR